VVVLLSAYVLFAPSAGGALPVRRRRQGGHLGLFACSRPRRAGGFGSSPWLLAAVASYAADSEIVQGLLLSRAQRRRAGTSSPTLAGAALGWWAAGRRLAQR
jgi:hypothetical protein